VLNSIALALTDTAVD